MNDDKAKYAVLINGEWGSGKTYLYENILKDEIAHLEYGRNESRGNVYISLYGISTVEQLAKELITNYLLKVKLHGSKKKEKAYENVSKITGIASKVFSLSINGLSIDLDKEIKEINNNIQFENMVICFDDLERCSIPINDLFGMINTLVEHCNCKVIILADENNIGKMYANTNIEAKYLTLLMGRKLGVKKDNEQNQGGDETSDKLTVEELKKLNEKIYSENYVYKDIKEKVIGLSLKYTPSLKEEFDSIIKDTINNSKLIKMLLERKEKIFEYMDLCENSNIRIMRVWLINFEKIFRVINNNFADNKYFTIIFDRFMIYTIRVACAIGKNKKLIKWEEGKEIGSVRLDDGFLFDTQGYRFVDDLLKDSLFDKMRICQAARSIERDKIEEERENERLLKGSAYRELQQWEYFEDEKILELVDKIKEELSNNEYAPQNYQNIISKIVYLKNEGFFDADVIVDITNIIKEKVENATEKLDVENFQQSFQTPEALAEYHKYYDIVSELIQKKNRELDKNEISNILKLEDGKKFAEFCKEHYNEFILKRTFVSLIDFNLLLKILKTGTIEEVYNISLGFRQVYSFSNLYEFYSNDVKLLRTLKTEVDNLQCDSKTRTRAIKWLSNTLEKIIRTIINKGEVQLK